MRTADQLVRAHFQEWEELEFLLFKGRLTAADVDRLGVLYRRVVSDLAVARRDFPGDRVARYLESLASRAHPVVFRGRVRALLDVGRLLAVDFPRAVRAIRCEVYLSATAFFGSLIVVMLLALLFPRELEPFVPGSMMERIRDVGERVESDGTSPWVHEPEATRPLLSYLIALNNVQVCLMAFAGGAFLGLFTLHILALNGILLGLVTGFSIREDAIAPLATFVAAHGFLELSVIVLSGAAGLAIGRAWMSPGDRPRLIVTVSAARGAVTVVLGGAVALLVAGMIEGLISPAEGIPPWMKLIIGLLVATVFWLFIAYAAREPATSV